MESWLLQLQGWITRLFKRKEKHRIPTTKIIQSWNNKDCIIHQIERDIPGAIATYRINFIGSEKYNYLITLDYLSVLQKELELEKQLAFRYHVSFRLRTHQLTQTHRFAVSRIWSNGTLHIFKAWDIDLEGFSASASIQERAPRQAVRYVVLSVLDVFYDPNIPNSWQFQIEDIDWLFLLRNRIREELSNPQHNLHEVIVFPGVETDTTH